MKKITPRYARLRERGLTLAQENAVDLLAAGKTDSEAAELLKVARSTVTRWRLYDLVFAAALNQRRAEIWGAAADRLRALIPQALAALADELARPDNPDRVKAAVAVLKLAPLPAAALVPGSSDPMELLRSMVAARRSDHRTDLEDVLDIANGLPALDEHLDEVLSELDAKAADGSEPE